MQKKGRLNSLGSFGTAVGLVLLLQACDTGANIGLAQTTHARQPVVQAPRADGFSAQQLVDDARRQIGVTVGYDPKYVVLPYPNGDVPENTGVCADVIVRAMRGQGIDLQKVLHEDMSRSFSQYPKRWGLSKPDANIDHRRVLNLETFMQRKHKALATTQNPEDYQPGDWVSWRVGDTKLPHIGIVSDRISASGTPLIIHNIGAGAREEDVLFAFPMVGHYRW